MNKLIEISQIQAMTDWDYAEEHLRRAMDGEATDSEMNLIKGRVFAGMNTLWKVIDDEGKVIAWATSNLYTADGINNIAQIHMVCTEDMKIFVDQLNEFEVWARNHHAHFIEVVGRQGWTKVLKPLGFKHNYTSLTKRIFTELH